MVAASYGHSDAMSRLIEAGANLEAADNKVGRLVCGCRVWCVVEYRAVGGTRKIPSVVTVVAGPRCGALLQYIATPCSRPLPFSRLDARYSMG